jgi:hypothetical protein
MLSFGMTNIPEDAPAGANAKALAKPPTGEETGRQVNYGERLYWTGDAFTPNGGACNNPCGFPGYGTLYAGSYATYRFMRKHPRIAHARAQVMSPDHRQRLGLGDAGGDAGRVGGARARHARTAARWTSRKTPSAAASTTATRDSRRSGRFGTGDSG